MRMKMCKQLGCDELVPYSQVNPYCNRHASQYHEYHRANGAAYQRHYNLTRRDPEANRFYHTQAWRQLSVMVKRQSMMTCECCGHTALENGKLLVDHIVPRRIDKRRQLDRDNLWTLCYRCHYWKTQLESQVYLEGDENFITNIDAATKWDKNHVQEWIMNKRNK